MSLVNGSAEKRLAMTWMKYLVESGACTTAELLQAAKTDATLKDTLKKWAYEEMKNKDIPIDDAK